MAKYELRYVKNGCPGYSVPVGYYNSANEKNQLIIDNGEKLINKYGDSGKFIEYRR